MQIFHFDFIAITSMEIYLIFICFEMNCYYEYVFECDLSFDIQQLILILDILFRIYKIEFPGISLVSNNEKA